MRNREIHQSLLRQPLFLGVGVEFLVFEVALVASILGLFGLRLASCLGLALLLVPAYVGMVILSERDPDTFRIVLDLLWRPTVSPPQGTLVPLRTSPPRASLPRI